MYGNKSKIYLFSLRLLTLHARESITKVTIPALTFIRAQGVLAVSVTVTLVLTLFAFVHVYKNRTIAQLY